MLVGVAYLVSHQKKQSEQKKRQDTTGQRRTTNATPPGRRVTMRSSRSSTCLRQRQKALERVKKGRRMDEGCGLRHWPA